MEIISVQNLAGKLSQRDFNAFKKCVGRGDPTRAYASGLGVYEYGGFAVSNGYYLVKKGSTAGRSFVVPFDTIDVPKSKEEPVSFSHARVNSKMPCFQSVLNKIEKYDTELNFNLDSLLKTLNTMKAMGSKKIKIKIDNNINPIAIIDSENQVEGIVVQIRV